MSGTCHSEDATVLWVGSPSDQILLSYVNGVPRDYTGARAEWFSQ